MYSVFPSDVRYKHNVLSFLGIIRQHEIPNSSNNIQKYVGLLANTWSLSLRFLCLQCHKILPLKCGRP